MKVMLVDDHKMMRNGLRAVLERDGIDVVGEAENGLEAIAEAKRVQPDVIVIDIAMPVLNGIDATRRLLAQDPSVKVVVLSMNEDRRYVVAMFEAGAVGYLLKRGASDELLLAVRAAVRGETYVSPAVAGKLVSHALTAAGAGAAGAGARRGLSPGRALKPLSPREREVLQLLAEGKASKEIASLLQIALPTVETHRRQLMDKLGLRTIAELTKYAIREGITSIDPSS